MPRIDFMNHCRHVGFVFLLMAASVAFGADQGIGDKLALCVTNRYGDVLTNLSVVRILDDGLIVGNNEAELKVPYGHLPPSIRAKYEALAVAVTNREARDAAATGAYVAHEKELQAEQAKIRKTLESETAQPVSHQQYLALHVPDQGWKITVLNPGLYAMRTHFETNQYVWIGYPGTNGFALKITVEKSPDGVVDSSRILVATRQAMARDPRIEQDSVKEQDLDKFFKVSYKIGASLNVNYYFAFKGCWVDVHTQKASFEPGDAQLFNDFQNALSYGE